MPSAVRPYFLSIYALFPVGIAASVVPKRKSLGIPL